MFMERNENCCADGDRPGYSPAGHPGSPEMDRNPSPPPEGEVEEEEPVEVADAIGETVYSKHWVFSTLTHLIQMVTEPGSGDAEALLELPEEREEELCKVWDMAMDEDVAGFLQEFKAPDILLGVITKSCSPRLTEICVGILGNMACFPATCLALSRSSDLGAVLLLLLGDRDPPTLRETCRLLLTCVCQPDAAPLWLERVRQQTSVYSNLCFIMQSSTNVELLQKVGELVDKLCDEDEELMRSWLRVPPSDTHDGDQAHDLASSLLEAAKQLRCEGPGSLQVYLHALQLLTTVNEGMGSMVCDGGAGPAVWGFVCEVVCEDLCQPDDPPLILQEQRALLAPTLTLLCALYTSLTVTAGPSLVESLLRVLLYHSQCAGRDRRRDGARDEEEEKGTRDEEEREGDERLQVVLQSTQELLSAVLTDLDTDAVAGLVRGAVLTETSCVTAVKALLPQHTSAVMHLVAMLSEAEPKLAGVVKAECPLPVPS